MQARSPRLKIGNASSGSKRRRAVVSRSGVGVGVGACNCGLEWGSVRVDGWHKQ